MENKIKADEFNTTMYGMITDDLKRTNRTVTVSFRLPMDMVGALAEESERAGSSPSSTLRQILGKHLNWDRYRLQMNLITVPTCFVKESLHHMTKKEIESIASQCAASFIELNLLKTKKLNLEGSLSLVEQWFRDSSIKYRRGYDEGCHVFAIQNELGFHWSLYLERFLAAICTNIEATPTHYKVDVSQNGKILLFLVSNNSNKRFDYSMR